MSAASTMTSPTTAPLAQGIESAAKALLGLQRADGHWVFELEADATIPAEYVLLRHYLGEEIDSALEAKIGNYLRRIQGAHGGWPLFHDGAFDMSASVKAYFALKMIGDSVDAVHMTRARGDPLARRRGRKQCLHAHLACALRRRAVARRAGHAGRDHALAGVVSIPSLDDFVLGAHGHRPAARSADAQAESAQSERRGHR